MKLTLKELSHNILITFVNLVIVLFFGIFSQQSLGAARPSATFTAPDNSLDGADNGALMLATSRAPTLGITGTAGAPYGSLAMNRIAWLRKSNPDKRGNLSASVKGFDAQFDEFTSQSGVNNLLNQLSSNLVPEDWSLWIEGAATTGNANSSDTSADLKITSHGISVGLDRQLNKTTLFGAVIRTGNEDIEIDASRSEIATDAYSISLYGSHSLDNLNYVDAVIGARRQSIDIKREHATGLYQGQRDAKQLFMSIALSHVIKQNNQQLIPYGRMNIARTKLGGYSESGSVAALIYDEQEISTAVISSGLLIDNSISTSFGTIKPNGRMEYGLDISQSSDADIAYVSAPLTQYSLHLDQQSKSSWRAGLGMDVEIHGGVILNADYERHQTVDSNSLETFKFSAAYQADSATQLDVGMSSMDNDWQWRLGMVVKPSSTLDLRANVSSKLAEKGIADPVVMLDAKLAF